MKNSSNIFQYYLYQDSRPHRGKTKPIQKGLVISRDSGKADLSEEGVGFGVPILQYRRDFYFSGKSTVSNQGLIQCDWCWKKFYMNLIEREQFMANKIQLFSWVIQRIYNLLYLKGLRVPFGPLSRLFSGGKTSKDQKLIPMFFHVRDRGFITTTYNINRELDLVTVELDFSNVVRENLQNIFVSTELGGNIFTHYFDSTGLKLSRKDIGEWNEVKADWAIFYSPDIDLGFKIDIPASTQIFRGREIIGDGDICWSGFIFKLKPNVSKFGYSILLGRRAYLYNSISE
ncbi:MAG: hypothetical protein GF411_19080 [Candidatus Lokiarchaeota archaeon]|nr:hypothetical protein [Candidatus Lokiarchaeota archaeon]